MGGLKIRVHMTKESVTLKMKGRRKERKEGRKESNLMKRDIND